MVSLAAREVQTSGEARNAQAAVAACFHCGEPCRAEGFANAEKHFCCQGCLTVHELLTTNGLAHFYDLNRHPGIRLNAPAREAQWAFLDQPELVRQLVDFQDDKVTRVTFQIPAIHCIACVWLLENLFQLHSAIGQCQVNFPRREVAIAFATGKLRLSELVNLLASIGYEPRLTLGELKQAAKPDRTRRKQWLQVGIAGFAFGNIMLFSLPAYLGLDTFTGPMFKALFGYLGLALALPVLIFSASDYWRSAFASLKQRVLTLDVPIALGLAAIYAQSACEILFLGRGGYLDSLCGLVFFLLCGRIFQYRTHERLAFDRDYKSFFPLAVTRKTAGGEQSVALSELRIGDRLLLRNGELIPTDCILIQGQACVDYSFVTGESAPVSNTPSAYLYAGGKQNGVVVEVEVVKPVSQSYLTSLWNHETFSKNRENNLNTLTNLYSRRFTRIVIAVALGAALFWLVCGAPGRAAKAFVSVLIVACPCALALAAPFALGTAHRLLARGGVFARNVLVLERLAEVDTIVLDKTGTLTSSQSGDWTFSGKLTEKTARLAYALASQSTHPLAISIAKKIGSAQPPRLVQDFAEFPGCGIKGIIEWMDVRLGSRDWLARCGVHIPESVSAPGSATYLAINGEFRGAFIFSNGLRPDVEQLVQRLRGRYGMALLSGDNESERQRFQQIFGSDAELRFNQTPFDKLEFVRALQSSGKKVLMVGDGLNDAGALKQSDVGIAVVEHTNAFSPASDVILQASRVVHLSTILRFARKAVRVVRVSFGISGLYNLCGISIAAAGILSPLICAVLMPLSSVSVVAFACGATHYAARRAGFSNLSST
jgi:Cu+-exporting ATPase